MSKKHDVSFWDALDWWTIALYLILVVWGWFTICGATYSFDVEELTQWGSRPIMQLVWFGVAVLIALAILAIHPSTIEFWTPLLYIGMLLLLGVTLFVAPDIKGSRSWLVMGPVRLQPAEFAKLATSLMLAWQFRNRDFRIQSIGSYILLGSIILIPAGIIIGQSETGSALVFFALFLALFREGFSGLFLGLAVAAATYFIGALMLDNVLWWRDSTQADLFVVGYATLIFSLVALYHYAQPLRSLVLGYSCVIVLVQVLAALVHLLLVPFDLSWFPLLFLVGLIVGLFVLSIAQRMYRYALVALFALGSMGFFYSTGYVFDNILQPHQQVRIKISLGIEEDIKGKGYNVDQSKIAIGSGGVWGKGFLQGTQTKLNYVPEQDTDFIFCTVGEERGFVGSTLLLVLYAALILRIVALAERQVETFGRVYAYCVASIFFFHLFVNVGMVIGIVPVIGIPLPFFSYGGSSLWGFSFLLFILLGMDARRHNRQL